METEKSTQLRKAVDGIIGLTELIREQLPNPEAKTIAKDILASARHLLEVIDTSTHLQTPGNETVQTSPAGVALAGVGHEVQPEGKSAARGRKKPKSAGRKLPDVLIVEDNLVNIQLLMIYIRRYCNIFSTQNALSAIHLTGERKFAAVLMDIHLGPGMDGIQAMHEIRSQPGNEKLPIIAVTAYATYGDREQFLASGFTDFIRKPIDREEIKKVLEKILEVK